MDAPVAIYALGMMRTAGRLREIIGSNQRRARPESIRPNSRRPFPHPMPRNPSRFCLEGMPFERLGLEVRRCRNCASDHAWVRRGGVPKVTCRYCGSPLHGTVPGSTDLTKTAFRATLFDDVGLTTNAEPSPSSPT